MCEVLRVVGCVYFSVRDCGLWCLHVFGSAGECLVCVFVREREGEGGRERGRERERVCDHVLPVCLRSRTSVWRRRTTRRRSLLRTRCSSGAR